MKKATMKKRVAAIMAVMCLTIGSTVAVASAKTKYVTDGKVSYGTTLSGPYAKYYYKPKGAYLAYHGVSVTNETVYAYDPQTTPFAGWTSKASVPAGTWGTYHYRVNWWQ